MKMRFNLRWLFGMLGILGWSSAGADCVYESPIQYDDLPIGVMLNWSTKQEDATAQFIIERSTDGFNYTAVGFVKAAGMSQEVNTYRFLDSEVKEKALYRLKLKDNDGTLSFSDAIVVNKVLHNKFIITRINGIVTSKITEVRVKALDKVQMQYSVQDLKGNNIFSGSQELKTGENYLHLYLDNFPEGKFRLVLQGLDAEKEEVIIQKISAEKFATLRENYFPKE